MKRRVFMILLVLVLALSAQGCGKAVRGSGKVVDQDRQVSDFTTIHLAGLGTVIIELGDQEALRIEAEDNLIEYLETEVRGGTLWIEQQDGVDLRPKEPVSFYVTAVALDAVAVSGSGEIKAPPLSAERFSVDVSGSGDVQIRALEAESLEVDISGSGQVDVSGGEVESSDVTISGSGEYDSRDVESATLTLRVSGSGDATVRARDHLQVDISGSGDVRYLGSPTLDTDVSGSGDIQRIGE